MKKLSKEQETLVDLAERTYRQIYTHRVGNDNDFELEKTYHIGRLTGVLQMAGYSGAEIVRELDYQMRLAVKEVHHETHQ